MAQHQVIGTKQHPPKGDLRSARITGLWIATQGDQPDLWPTDKVKKAIREKGDVFLVYRVPAAVRIGHSEKQGEYLTTYGDRTLHNNLNDLPMWETAEEAPPLNRRAVVSG